MLREPGAFTKVGKEISVAVKAGGPDPVSNSKLRDLIDQSKVFECSQ